MTDTDSLPPYSPFPNALIDEVMPLLRDTQWRVLCVIVRQTLGWRSSSGTGRKTEDWLTQSQLKRRTGRASEALSKAVDGLVRRGLIEVADAQGNALRTPAKRRRCRGRLYYRLASRCLVCPPDDRYPQAYPQLDHSPVDNRHRRERPALTTSSITEHRIPNTTETNSYLYATCGQAGEAAGGAEGDPSRLPSVRLDGWFKAVDVTRHDVADMRPTAQRAQPGGTER